MGPIFEILIEYSYILVHVVQAGCFYTVREVTGGVGRAWRGNIYPTPPRGSNIAHTPEGLTVANMSPSNSPAATTWAAESFYPNQILLLKQGARRAQRRPLLATTSVVKSRPCSLGLLLVLAATTWPVDSFYPG